MYSSLSLGDRGYRLLALGLGYEQAASAPPPAWLCLSPPLPQPPLPSAPPPASCCLLPTLAGQLLEYQARACAHILPPQPICQPKNNSQFLRKYLQPHPTDTSVKLGLGLLLLLSCNSFPQQSSSVSARLSLRNKLTVSGSNDLATAYF